MPLDIIYSHTTQVVKTSFGFGVGYVPSIDGGFPHTVDIHDLLLAHLRSFVFTCPAYARTVDRVLGFNVPSSSVDTKRTVSFKPSSWHHNTESYDRRYYGSFFQNIQLAGSLITGQSIVTPSPIRESVCRHSTYNGELSAQQVDVPSVPLSYSFWGYSIPTTTTNGLVYDRAIVNSVGPLRITVSSTGAYGGLWNVNILPILEFLQGRVVTNISLVESVVIERVLSKLSFNINHDRLTINYHMSARHIGGTEHIEWDSEVFVPFQEPPRIVTPIVGHTFSAFQGYPCMFSYRITYDNTENPDPGPRYEQYTDTVSYVSACLFSSFPPDPDESNSLASTTFDQLLNRRFLDPFEKSVKESWSDIVPSSLFAAVDAFKHAEGYVGVNILQNLVKIPDIYENVTFVRDAIKVLGDVLHKDLSLSSLKDILDLVTSANLRGNFEIRPYLEVLTKYLPLMISTLHTLRFQGNVTGYGSYRFKFSNEFTRQDVTLVTRTKMVMDTSPSGLLSAVLGIDALGLLPKASNLWDLIPFTFVVNWFTGVGEAIRRAEYTIYMATIPAYFVHTYSLSSPLSEDELVSLKTSSSGPIPASLKLYYRDVTTYNPAFRSSRFAFGIPVNLPSIGIIGSLLYQLIFR